MEYRKEIINIVTAIQDDNYNVKSINELLICDLGILSLDILMDCDSEYSIYDIIAGYCYIIYTLEEKTEYEDCAIIYNTLVEQIESSYSNIKEIISMMMKEIEKNNK